MLDISKLKILENKRFVCLVRYKILKALYIMITNVTKGHRDATTERKNVRAYKVTEKDCWIQTENKSQPIIISNE